MIRQTGLLNLGGKEDMTQCWNVERTYVWLNEVLRILITIAG